MIPRYRWRSDPSFPSYEQLVQMYYDAQKCAIAEYSGNIARDTFALYLKCCAWCPTFADSLPEDEMAQIEEWRSDNEISA